MTDDHSLFPLEKYLKDNSTKVVEFPNGSSNYFTRYKALKDYLANKVWPFIGAATSSEDGGIYTDHGPDHFNQVIRYAGMLLGIDQHTDKFKVTPYEAYLILTAILLHDSGNIFGRKGHEKKALKIIREAGGSIVSDRFEAKLIACLAAVHGGKIIDDNNEDKDVIGAQNWPHTDDYSGIPYRPNLIAAIVRFADEICEDSNRAAQFLLNTEGVIKESEVFHRYAACISSVKVDLMDKSIAINYEINIEQVPLKYGKLEAEVYLIDEIFSRLEKMNCERIYCLRFMAEIVQLSKIKAEINICKGGDFDDDVVDKLSVLIQEKGYPEPAVLLVSDYPEWAGGVLQGRLSDDE